VTAPPGPTPTGAEGDGGSGRGGRSERGGGGEDELPMFGCLKIGVERGGGGGARIRIPISPNPFMTILAHHRPPILDFNNTRTHVEVRHVDSESWRTF